MPEPPFSKGIFSRPGFFGSSGTTAEEFGTFGVRPSFGATPQSVARSQAPVSLAEIESLQDPFKLRAFLSPQELLEAGLLKPNLTLVELQSGVKAQLRQKGRLLTEPRQTLITSPTGSRSFASKRVHLIRQDKMLLSLTKSSLQSLLKIKQLNNSKQCYQ